MEDLWYGTLVIDFVCVHHKTIIKYDIKTDKYTHINYYHLAKLNIFPAYYMSKLDNNGYMLLKNCQFWAEEI